MPKDSSKLSKAIILGRNLRKMGFRKKLRAKNITTPYGKVSYFQFKDCVFIPRHGIKESIPPHRINYRANIFAIKKLGIKYIFSFSSVGSLKTEIKPGDFVIASDYIDFDPPTFYEKEAKFIAPQLSLKLSRHLSNLLKRLRISFKHKGIYFCSKGPRLETKAEIQMIKNFADLVGMTITREATLSQELGLEYVSLCSVDNYAHGITKKPISMQAIFKNQLKTKVKIERIIKEIMKSEIK